MAQPEALIVQAKWVSGGFYFFTLKIEAKQAKLVFNGTKSQIFSCVFTRSVFFCDETSVSGCVGVLVTWPNETSFPSFTLPCSYLGSKTRARSSIFLLLPV